MTAVLFAMLVVARPVNEPLPSPYEITCTTSMVGDIVRQIAGDRARVSVLIGEGVDPHLYKATRQDLGKLLNADVIFYNGLMLEGRMADALIQVARKKPNVHAVIEALDDKLFLEPPDFDGHHDPHLWMNVSLWLQAADGVRLVLSQIDPPNASGYSERYASYAKTLQSLDHYARATIGTIPKDQRVLVTAHDAFNYLAQAYAIEVIGIQGISTDSEAGIEDINRIVDLLVKRRVSAVFVETSVSEKNVRALIEGAAARGHRVEIGGALFSDAMGRPGTYEGTYVGMIDHNVTTITRALGGSAPARGMQGKLKAP
jgi:manganese/zinc/iron transport system substrate-binding protein